MCFTSKVAPENNSFTESRFNKKENKGALDGHTCSCVWDKKSVIGVIALVIAAIMLIFAIILASGVFGGGTKGFIAGGLVIGSMIAFGTAAFLFFPNHQVVPKK
ncbi:MAG TPA: hypothetical protein VIH61_07715 [Waddliaceae bacterium]